MAIATSWFNRAVISDALWHPNTDNRSLIIPISRANNSHMTTIIIARTLLITESDDSCIIIID